MRRTELGWLTACPFCGEDTLFDGQRRYWPSGFPDVHECKPVLTIPNEHDFEERPAPKVKTPTRTQQPRVREIRGIEA